MIIEKLKKKIEPFFPFYTYKKKEGIGFKVFSLKGKYIVYYETESGKKSMVKFEYDHNQEYLNILKYSSEKIDEVEDEDYDRKRIIQVDSEISDNYE